jgi:hypothetical protein
LRGFHLLDAGTLERLDDPPFTPYSLILNQFTNEIILSDGHVYMAEPPWTKVDFINPSTTYNMTISASQDGTMLFGKASTQSGDTMLAIYMKQGITWQVTQRIYLKELTTYRAVFSSADSKTVCIYGNDSYSLGKRTDMH